jgi:hypothetical protein
MAMTCGDGVDEDVLWMWLVVVAECGVVKVELDATSESDHASAGDEIVATMQALQRVADDCEGVTYGQSAWYGPSLMELLVV